MNNRLVSIILTIFFIISLSAFLFLVLALLMDPTEGALSDLVSLMKDSPAGSLIVIAPGLLSIVFAISLVALYSNSLKWKELRFKMAFYLYHSKVQRDEIIPLSHLARVAVCKVPEIERTLNRMISLDELKGIVDEERGIYIHKGLTRRTMRILTALPPARVHQLDDVKQWALKGASAYAPGESLEELEPVEIEELPSATEDLMKRRSERTVPCPVCGRLNREGDHFCTFCGEVID